MAIGLVLAGCSAPPAESQGAQFAAFASQNFAKDWNLDELIKVADPDFLKKTPRAKLEPMLGTFREKLGPVVKFGPVVLNSTQIGKQGQPIEVYSRELQCQKMNKPVYLFMTVQAPEAHWTLLAFRVTVSRQEFERQP